MKWSPISGLIIWAKGLNSLYWKLSRKFQTTESFIFGVFGNLALAFLIVIQGAINSQIVCHQNALPTDPEFTDYRFIEDFVSQYCWNGGKIGGVEGVRFWFVHWYIEIRPPPSGIEIRPSSSPKISPFFKFPPYYDRNGQFSMFFFAKL